LTPLLAPLQLRVWCFTNLTIITIIIIIIEQNEVDGMEKGADTTDKVMHI